MKKDNLTDLIQSLPKKPVAPAPKPQQVTNPQGQTVTLGAKKR